MGRITRHVGDFGPLAKMSFVVKDSEGAVVNLTSYTVNVIVSKTTAFYFSGECDLDDAVNGLCSYTPTDGQIDATGDYDIQLKITKSTTDLVYVNAGILTVKTPLPES